MKARQLVRGGQRPDGEGLLFSYYSQEAEDIRRK